MDPESRAWVLDTPANNAMAHFLHNALFLLGPAMDRSAMPVEVQGELYRALQIESADTAACRLRTDAGADVLFLASHATELGIDPRFRLECDDAVITCGEHSRDIVARTNAGEARSYGDPDSTSQFQKLFVAIDLAHASRGAARETDTAVACGPEAAMAQTLAVNGLHESAPTIVNFPAASVCRPEADRFAVRGLREQLLDLYRFWQLPSEAGYDWASAGRVVDLREYTHFPGGWAPVRPAPGGRR
jgi:hypothetical protein